MNSTTPGTESAATFSKGGVTVPSAYKHELNTRPERDNDQRELDIRRLIENSKGKVLTADDFVTATGVTSALLHVRRLMKTGRVTRKQVKNGKRGHAYAYTWHDELTNSVMKSAIMANGEVVTKNLNFPEVLFSEHELEKLNKALIAFIHRGDDLATNIVGAAAFVKWAANDIELAKSERERILKEHQEGKNGGTTH